MRSVCVAAVVAAACAVVVSAADPPLRLESAWTAEPVTVDGALDEWADPLAALPDALLWIGVKNDGAALYVALRTNDRATQLLLGRAGFTVWWDAKGRQRKDTGLGIPSVLGAPAARRRSPRFGEGEEQAAAPPAIDPVGHVVVIGPKREDQRRLEAAFAGKVGLLAAAKADKGAMAYEIRVPLVRTDAQPYAVGLSEAGGAIALGIETNDMPKPPPPSGSRGGRGGGGGGMLGGMMGGGSWPTPEEGMPRPKPVKAWTLVQLSASR